jgi:phosphoglycerate dehydrogenase-like enzyme
MSMSTSILFFRVSDPADWRNIYFSSGSADRFVAELGRLGTVTVVPFETPETEVLRLVREHDIVVSSPAPPLPAAWVQDPGRLRYVCCLHGGVRGIVSRAHLDAGLLVTNWGDSPGHGLAFLSVTLLLAVLRELPTQMLHVRQGGWRLDASYAEAPRIWGGTAEGLRVGVYGMGFAGRCFVPMAQGMGLTLSGYDPYVPPTAWPEGVRRAASLADLFAGIQALVVCAALTDETRNSVTGERLARLPDGGIVINTARGAIIEQDALFAELLTGRLRAGLDVLEPDCLPPEHPVRRLPNCILTCHVGPQNRFNAPAFGRNERYALENIRRFVAAEPLQWLVDVVRFDRMT